MSAAYPENLYPGCPCFACDQVNQEDQPEALRFMRMSLCPACGNKRCPAAMNHRAWKCSGSNDVGQIAEAIR